MPIILKGVATAEDAILAYEAGCQGVVLSNHGGRQLDTARSGLEVLVEVVAALKAKGYYPDPKFEIFIDGGVRRASDVLKAIALGAKAVGVGRAFLYAFCAYGQEGVERAIQIFRDEFEMNMRLLGARTIDELVPEMVDASALSQHIVTVPQDNLFSATCEFSYSLFCVLWMLIMLQTSRCRSRRSKAASCRGFFRRTSRLRSCCCIPTSSRANHVLYLSIRLQSSVSISFPFGGLVPETRDGGVVLY